MGLPSNRNLEFVGITVQNDGHLIFQTHYGVVGDQCTVTVRIRLFLLTLQGSVVFDT